MTQSELRCQRDLFSLADDDAYLNGASRSPQLKAVAAAGRHAISWRERDSGMPIPAFFEPVERVRKLFSDLIGADDPDRVALIPAASYGIATVAKNLPVSRGQHIVVVEGQFPSNYYAWQGLCADAGASLRTVGRPGKGANWSNRVLEAIDENTAAVAIAPLHWADGTLFDLVALRKRTSEVGAWLVVDGTQAIGALPFDVREIQPDALVCGAYKWLMAPYGCGLAYYGPRMDNGKPIEENWINRAGSEDFRNLVNYQEGYRPKAGRYSVGEHSNFFGVAMMEAALQQVVAWGPERIQAYTGNLWSEVAGDLTELGVTMPEQRANHLVGLSLPDHRSTERLAEELRRRKISVSLRGDAVRVSPNVYNRADELGRLVAALR